MFWRRSKDPLARALHGAPADVKAAALRSDAPSLQDRVQHALFVLGSWAVYGDGGHSASEVSERVRALVR